MANPKDNLFTVSATEPTNWPAVLLLFAISKELQQLDKEVDDVEVERGCRKDVLLSRDFLHDHVDVVDDVE